MAYYNNYQPPVAQQSKYHGAFQKQDRLHNYWVMLSFYWRQGEMRKMNFEMENIWCEFYGDASPKERTTFETLCRKVFNYFTLASQQTKPNEKLKYWNKASEYIKRKRLFLMVVSKRQGHDKAYKEEDEDLF